MRLSLLDKLCCPVDKHELTSQIFAQLENGDVTEGLLTCPSCKRYYPVVYGIPIMTPDEYREKTLEEPILKKWGLALEETEKQKFLLKTKNGTAVKTD